MPHTPDHKKLIREDSELYHALNSVGVIADANERNEPYLQPQQSSDENIRDLPPDILRGPTVKSPNKMEDDTPNYEDWSDEEILAEEKRVNRHVSNAAMGLLNPGADALDTFIYIDEYFKGQADLSDIGWSLANFLPFAAFGKMKKLKALEQLRLLKRARGIGTHTDDILKHTDELGGLGGPARPVVDIIDPKNRFSGPRSISSSLDDQVKEQVKIINANNRRSIDRINSSNAHETVKANQIARINKESKAMTKAAKAKDQKFIDDMLERNPQMRYEDGRFIEMIDERPSRVPGYLRKGKDWVSSKVWDKETASPWIRRPLKTGLGVGGAYLGTKHVVDPFGVGSMVFGHQKPNNISAGKGATITKEGVITPTRESILFNPVETDTTKLKYRTTTDEDGKITLVPR